MANIKSHQEDDDSIDKYVLIKSKTKEPFARYTKDPLFTSKSSSPRTARIALSKGRNTLQPPQSAIVQSEDATEDVSFACSPFQDTLKVPSCENIVDEPVFLKPKMKEPFARYIKDPLIASKSPSPQETTEELFQKNNRYRIDNPEQKMASDVSSCVDSDDDYDSLKLKTKESFARYVKDPLITSKNASQRAARKEILEVQGGIQDIRALEQLPLSEVDQHEEELEDVFVAFYPCTDSLLVPNSEERREKLTDECLDRKKYACANNSLIPPIFVFGPTLQDVTSSNDAKEITQCLNHASNQPTSLLFKHTNERPSQDRNEQLSNDFRMSDQATSDASGSYCSRLSYFSYLGDDFSKSWHQASPASSVCTSRNQRMISVSSYNSSEVSRFTSDLSSPTSSQYHLTTETERPEKFDQVIDYCSCMCCAKALFYHCTKDGDSGDLHDEPCYCEQPGTGCMKRWCFLSVLTCFMPCLVFYAPLKGLQKATKKMRRFFRKHISRFST